ncbi:MAG: hypothetical protein LC777_02820 [Actinobacteria bacterium]|nr:hypothetical protein [Actinomycetota bacterium]
MLFGYARVSTADQNPDHQIDALSCKLASPKTPSTSTARAVPRPAVRSSTSYSSCCATATR